MQTVSITSSEEIQTHLKHVDGVMIGRAAYGNPYLLATVDRQFFGDNHPILSRQEILINFLPYLEQNQDKFSIILPHLMGLFHGQPNAKSYRQVLMTKDISALKAFAQHTEI